MSLSNTDSGAEKLLNSAIYRGQLRHRRFRPKAHDFTYNVFMMYLDLDELDTVFSGTRWWSSRRSALARFSAKDFFHNKDEPLARQVRDYVFSSSGIRVTGAVRMLANLRYFGYIFNPLVCYYCFDHEEQLVAIVAEVTNTPWKEKHIYVLPCDPNSSHQTISFDKAFHVSPFQPMNTRYLWQCSLPDEKLAIHMQSFELDDNVATAAEGKFFDATLTLQKEAISPSRLNQLLKGYPLMTLKVVGAIYWQALKLAFKKMPFYSHPQKAQ